MISNYLRFVGLACLLIVLQVWVFSPMSLWRLATPMVYPLLLLFLPMNYKPISLTLIGFAVGSAIDYFAFTPGLHAATFSFVAFVRYYLLKFILDAQDDPTLLPLPSTLKDRSYILLAEILLLEHILLYGLASGLHFDIVYTLLRLGSSFAFSYLLAVMMMLSLSVRLSPQTSHGK